MGQREIGAADDIDEIEANNATAAGSSQGGESADVGNDGVDNDEDGVELHESMATDAAGEGGEGGSPAGGAPANAGPVDFGQALLETARSQYGLTNYEDPQALVNDLWAAAQQAQQFQAESRRQQQQLQQYQQHIAQLQQSRGQGQQPAAQQPPQPERKPWWSPPQYSPTLVQQYREPDPDRPGQLRWKAETPIDVQQGHIQHEAYVREWAHKMATNPTEAFTPMLEAFYQDKVQKGIQEAIQQQLQPMQATWQAQQVMQRNLASLAQPDANGMPMYDPQTGRPVLSQMGQATAGYVGQLAEAGVGDYGVQMQLASRLARLDAIEAQLAQQNTINQRDAAARQAVRGATLANGTQPTQHRRTGNKRPATGQGSQKGLSLLERMKAKMAEGQRA